MEAGSQPQACDVCGRTFLAGETPRTYVTRDDELRSVCELCRPRAEAAGWILEGRINELPPVSGERSRAGGRVRRLLIRARESAAIAASRPPREDEGHAASGAAPPRQAPQRELESDFSPAAPARRHSVPQSPERRVRRAFDRFNASEHRRMVAGLIRSLGQPSVSAVTSGSALGEVRITVAWELAWYQWEVDIAREGAPMRELAKGDEVSELDEADKQWNAHASADGELVVGVETGESDG